jgi:hypothetical protein
MSKRKDDEEKADQARDGESEKDEACESDSTRAKDEDDESRIGTVREKIGEGPGNLRQRGEWYKRRTGGSED